MEARRDRRSSSNDQSSSSARARRRASFAQRAAHRRRERSLVEGRSGRLVGRGSGGSLAFDRVVVGLRSSPAAMARLLRGKGMIQDRHNAGVTKGRMDEGASRDGVTPTSFRARQGRPHTALASRTQTYPVRRERFITVEVRFSTTRPLASSVQTTQAQGCYAPPGGLKFLGPVGRRHQYDGLRSPKESGPP